MADAGAREAGASLIDVGGDPERPAWVLLGRRSVTRHGFLPVRVVALNQTLDPMLDQPWIERNGFFGSSPDRFGFDLDCLLQRLATDPWWDEIRLPGLDEDVLPQVRDVARRHRLRLRSDLEVPRYSIDLARLRSRHSDSFLAGLSANARQQLRSSRRRIERDHGALRLDQTLDLREASAWLDAAGAWHLERWGPSSGANVPASGFANPTFVDFHRRLVSAALPAGRIQLLRIAAGDRVFAYLYNFVTNGRVEFYLSGIDYTVGEPSRPGLLAHWLAVEHALSAGMDAYDFLGGEARYKRTLSDCIDRMTWVTLERPRLRLHAERAGRALKRRIRTRGGGAS